MNTQRIYSVPEPDHSLSEGDRRTLERAFGATEWGYRTENGSVHPCASRQMAERMAEMRTRDGGLYRPGAVVVSRKVAPWVEAEA